MPEIASKFLFTSSRCELPYQLPLLISLRSGIKSQSIAETIFLTFYGRKKLKENNKFTPLNFIMLLISGTINASAVTLFLTPVHLYDSGFSGTSMLLAQLTPESFSLSMFLLILNIPFFLYGCKKQGLIFTVYSIFALPLLVNGLPAISSILHFPEHSAARSFRSVTDCRTRFAFMCNFWRTHFRCRQRHDNQIWRCN